MQIYVDCDGVLADFNYGARKVFGLSPEEAQEKLGAAVFWRRLRDQPNFYGSLPLLPCAERLMQALAPHKPIILTGAPRGDWAKPQKIAWGRQHFPTAKVIVCAARDKCAYCRPGDLLIDDWTRHQHLWLAAGGRYLHYRNIDQALAELQELLADAPNGQPSEQP